MQDFRVMCQVTESKEGLRGVTLLHSLVSFVKVDYRGLGGICLVFGSLFGTWGSAAVVLKVVI